MGAPVVWFEIAGRDLDGLGRFYEELLGWKLNADNPMRYGMVDTGAQQGIPGGIYAADGTAADYVSFYVEVPELEAALAGAERLGGRVAQPPTPLGSGARIAMFLDPEGHRIGLIQPAAAEGVPSS